MSDLPPPPLLGWRGIPSVWQRWFNSLFNRVGGSTGRLVVIQEDGSDQTALDELEERIAAIPEATNLAEVGARLSNIEGQIAGVAEPNVSDILRRLEALEDSVLQPSAFDATGGLRASQQSPVLAIAFNYAINPRFVITTVANGGTATQSDAQAVLQTSTASNGSARIESCHAARYVSGTGMFASFACVFTAGVANSQQEVGTGDLSDGFFAAYVGASFGFLHRRGGSDTFIAQTSWNVDKLDGAGRSGYTLDPTTSNVYKVQWLWHGSGPINFYVMPGGSSEYVLVHQRPWAGTASAPSLLDPTIPLWARAVNSGNTTNLTVKVGSMAMYTEGYDGLGLWPQISANGSQGNSKTGISAETSVLTLRNKATNVLGGTNTNKTRVKLSRVSLVSASGATTFRIMVNSTLGGSPSYTSWSNLQSVVEYDTAGTTITGGMERFYYYDPAFGTAGLPQSIDIGSLNIVLSPGDTASLTAAGTTVSPHVSVQWEELF